MLVVIGVPFGNISTQAEFHPGICVVTFFFISDNRADIVMDLTQRGCLFMSSFV